VIVLSLLIIGVKALKSSMSVTITALLELGFGATVSCLHDTSSNLKHRLTMFAWHRTRVPSFPGLSLEPCPISWSQICHKLSSHSFILHTMASSRACSLATNGRNTPTSVKVCASPMDDMAPSAQRTSFNFPTVIPSH
jgi:hypothetical protein